MRRGAAHCRAAEESVSRAVAASVAAAWASSKGGLVVSQEDEHTPRRPFVCHCRLELLAAGALTHARLWGHDQEHAGQTCMPVGCGSGS